MYSNDQEEILSYYLGEFLKTGELHMFRTCSFADEVGRGRELPYLLIFSTWHESCIWGRKLSDSPVKKDI